MCPSDNNPAALPLASLPGLPEELCLAVIEQCDMSSMIALLQTSRRFYKLIDPHDKARRPQMEEFLIEAQFFPRYQEQDGFACFACTKILPRSNFTDKHTKAGPRSRLGFQQRKRFCIPCGIDKGFFTPGTLVKQGYSLRLVCRGCKQLKEAEFCRRCMFCTACIRMRLQETGRWTHNHHMIREELTPLQVDDLRRTVAQALMRLSRSFLRPSSTLIGLGCATTK
jgi:hypothetical protein